MRATVPLVFLLGVAAVGCAPAPATIRVDFSSLDTFLRSDTARLVIVQLSEGEGGLCPVLKEELVGGTGNREYAYDTGETNICAFQSGEVEVEAVPAGQIAVVFVAHEGRLPVVSGCHVTDLYGADSEVSVGLSLTAEFRRQYGSNPPPPPCSSVADKCGGSC